MGRKPTKTTKLKQIFLEAYEASGGNTSVAVRAVGLHRATPWTWRQTDPEFDQRMVEIEEALIDRAESRLQQQIDDGNLKAICFYLDRKARLRGYGSTFTLREWAVREPDESVAILRKFKAGEITIQDAAIEYAMAGIPLPEPIKILLSRSKPPVEDAPEEFGKSAEELEAELDAEYERKMAEVDRQKAEFIPQREQEVQELKDELKGQDSFRDGIEAMIEKEQGDGRVNEDE